MVSWSPIPCYGRSLLDEAYHYLKIINIPIEKHEDLNGNDYIIVDGKKLQVPPNQQPMMALLVEDNNGNLKR